MPRQSSHVAGYIAPFSLYKIYMSNITNNSYLMSPGPLCLHRQCCSAHFHIPLLCLSAVWGADTPKTPLLQKYWFKKKKKSSYIIVLYSHLYDTVILYSRAFRGIFWCNNLLDLRHSDCETGFFLVINLGFAVVVCCPQTAPAEDNNSEE